MQSHVLTPLNTFCNAALYFFKFLSPRKEKAALTWYIWYTISSVCVNEKYS